jgi:hypothetical protein
LAPGIHLSSEILFRYAFHAEYLDFYVRSMGQRVGHFVHCLFVHLHAVDGQAWAGVQLFVAYVAFEVLGLLVLN